MASEVYGFVLPSMLMTDNIKVRNDYLIFGYAIWISNSPAIYK